MTSPEKGSAFQRWSFWWVLVAGLVGGFVMFCVPELRLKAVNPRGWESIWGVSRVPTCVRCTVFSVLEGLGAALVYLAVYYFFPGLRWKGKAAKPE